LIYSFTFREISGNLREGGFAMTNANISPMSWLLGAVTFFAVLSGLHALGVLAHHYEWILWAPSVIAGIWVVLMSAVLTALIALFTVIPIGYLALGWELFFDEKGK